MKRSLTSIYIRALLCTSLVGLLPACMPKAYSPAGQPYSRQAPFISATPYIQAHNLHQQSIGTVQPRPVLYAQVNTQSAGLRGPLKPQQEKFYSASQNPQARQQIHIRPSQFQHHLDEGARIQNVQRTPVLQVPVQPAPPIYAPTQPREVSSRPALQPHTKPSVGAAQTINPSEQSLQQSLGAAVQHSPLLAIEDLKIQEAQEALVQSKAQSKFKLDLNGVVGPTQSETTFSVVNGSTSDFRINRGANLNLSLPIYQGGRIKAENNVAAVGIEEAKANFKIIETAVAQDAAIAHFNIVRDRQLVQIYEQNVHLLKSQKNTVSALLTAGENTVTDQALVDSRLALIEVNLEQARANLAVNESTYKKLVGRPAPNLLPAQTVPLPDTLSEIKSVAQQNNPQLKAAQTRIEAAHHNIDVAKSFGRPKLALQGVARSAEGQSETIRRNSAVEVLLNLNVPILSGGENKSRIRQAALAQSRAILESRSILDDVNERIEQLWANIESARRSQAPNRAQIKAAQKAYEAISKQRDAGVATALDVQSIEQTLLDAQINLIQAINTENVSRFQLLSLMGVL